MNIPFVQYLRPSGRKSEVSIDMPEDIWAKAQALIAADCHFDIEELSTGMVSMTCETFDHLLSIQVCENGPAVVTAVETLVMDAYQRVWPQ